ncbi:hypothetical protein EVAR_62275_1 [Eumeta japonica]|uniref:Larval cuticle protein 1 n=1 Tax=Eumeta variegata TaxID=151549 RepID=A0A4C1YZI9_EUMVA|nr:hypothetical protein EVAR_62275_1 [Eumeta japonica]
MARSSLHGPARLSALYPVAVHRLVKGECGRNPGDEIPTSDRRTHVRIHGPKDLLLKINFDFHLTEYNLYHNGRVYRCGRGRGHGCSGWGRDTCTPYLARDVVEPGALCDHFVVVALALVAAASAAPADVKEVKILRYENDQKPDGSYNLAVETDDGSARQEEGTVKEVVDEENKPHAVVVVRGSYKFLAPDGTPVEITYTADENGFQAQGEAIPKVPARR